MAVTNKDKELDKEKRRSGFKIMVMNRTDRGICKKEMPPSEWKEERKQLERKEKREEEEIEKPGEKRERDWKGPEGINWGSQRPLLLAPSRGQIYMAGIK